MNNQNTLFGYTPPPLWEKPKIETFRFIHFDECSKTIIDPFYLRNIIYLAKILKALLSNKNGILYF